MTKGYSLDLDEAIWSHSEWKRRLKSYLSHPDDSLDVDELAANNKCDLGRWIEEGGDSDSTLPEFATLRAEHTRFHQAVADLVRRAQCGNEVLSELAPISGSEFSTASASVVRALVEMKKRTSG